MAGPNSYPKRFGVLVWLVTAVGVATVVLASPPAEASPLPPTSAATAPVAAPPMAVTVSAWASSVIGGATPIPGPSTTFAPLGNLPVSPTTDPLITRAQSGHVSGVLAVVSIGGFAVALLLVTLQVFLTRRPRRRRGARTL